jgi:MoaA/NifB/PqqE/SkfB family radical SAM enzyme
MCNIWQDDTKDGLHPKDFARLPKTLKDLNITGGEPFLRNDLVDIVREITNVNPKIRIVISSNGFLTAKIIDDMQ